MSNEIDKQIKQEIRVLTLLDELANALRDNPELQDKVSERMSSSATGRELREVVLQRRAAQSYYNEEYALALQPHLDRMIETDCKRPILFARSAFPGVSHLTIYFRVYQAWQWLRDRHPEKQKYIDLYERTVIVKSPKMGVRIQVKQRAAAELIATEIDEGFEHLMQLQSAISEALKAPQTIPFAIIFEKKNLCLNEDDQNTIKDGLAGVEGLTVKVTEHSVVIARRVEIV